MGAKGDLLADRVRHNAGELAESRELDGSR
jgi:hypothetical protein